MNTRQDLCKSICTGALLFILSGIVGGICWKYEKGKYDENRPRYKECSVVLQCASTDHIRPKLYKQPDEQ